MAVQSGLLHVDPFGGLWVFFLIFLKGFKHCQVNIHVKQPTVLHICPEAAPQCILVVLHHWMFEIVQLVGCDAIYVPIRHSIIG